MSRSIPVIGIAVLLPLSVGAFMVAGSFVDLSPAAVKAFGESPPATAARSPAPGTLFLYPERVDVEGRGLVDAERGVIFVPVKRSDPQSEIIGVEVYRFMAKESAPRGVPPIFHLHGGPGFPGLGDYLENPQYYDRVVDFFTGVGDYIVVGQRGIGTSKPSTICQSLDSFEADAVREGSARCRAYWESKGLDLSGLNVVEAAGDVADVAAALGYDQIVVWGGSFGSHWGMTVLRYYPELVARAVLSGMEGPDHTYDSPTGVLNALERLAAEAEASSELNDLIPDGGLIAALETVIARVDEQPVTVEVPDRETGKSTSVTFDADDVRGMATGYTRSVSSRAGAATWPADILTLYSGDFTEAGKRRVQRESSGGTRTASYFMLDCGSGITAERLARYKADPAAAIVGDKTWWYQTSCPPWGADLGDEFRLGFETDIPTVIVHGDRDVNTPLENALELAPSFHNGVLIIVKGGSHGALGEAIEDSQEFGEALAKFVVSGDISDLPDEVELKPVEWVVPESLKQTSSQ